MAVLEGNKLSFNSPASSDGGVLFFCDFGRFETANLKFIQHAVTATTEVS